ncbi:putative ferric-chelate reductase 1 homolog isoform X2 [Palaemon carinicauda]|uniref:putative ferric-chelate reductase 1 homolog isoform X2 n=1 Tax=Palaemon carinicauda TaxID=392227 RepID=UPI0035B61E7C
MANNRKELRTPTLTAALLLLLATNFPLSGVMGYSRGAPDTACGHMIPGHGAGTTQISSSPYTIAPGAATLEGGKRMLVTLQTPDGVAGFEGFLVQARNADDESQVVGTFFTTDHSYITCGKGFNNAVTHTSNAKKPRVLLEWEAPSDYTGDVVFKATFVQEYEKFWVGVTSEKVTITQAPGSQGGGPASVVPPAPVPETTSTTTTTEFSDFEVASLQNTMQNIYLGCRVNKGCFGFPSGCIDAENCQMLATYAKVSSGYKFEIMGDAANDAYVAIGLSDDQKMGKDSVMACTSTNGQVDVLMGFNSGKSNEILTDSKYGLSDIKTAGIDGRVYCSFIRQAMTEINNIQYNLQDERYHLMLAKGPAASPAKLSYHNAREVTVGTSSMDEFAALESSQIGDLYLKLHACFMIGAWVFAASTGILLARYYKQTWLDNRCCGIDQWFHFHRLFMILTWGLTIAGFVLIVIHVGGWVDDPISENPHPIIGIVSIGLCFIQPFMALCRCSPNHKRRPLFNWLHWFVGNSAQILGLTAIFFGFDLIHSPKWTWFILIIFIAFHCIVHLILSIGQCVSDYKGDKSNNVFPLKEMNGSRSPLHPVDKREDAPGGTFRKTMLAIYLIVVSVITALLMLIVVAGEEQLRDWKLLFWEK